MDGFWQALMRTEWLVGAAVAVVILGLVGLIALYKPYVIPIRTHEEQLAAERARADKAQADAAAAVVAAQSAVAEEARAVRAETERRVDNVIAARKEQSEQAERFFNTALTEAKRYADDWKGTAHITAENAKISEDRMDEVLETVRLMAGILTALQNHARQQLPPGSS